jgi:hypothetical protein
MENADALNRPGGVKDMRPSLDLISTREGRAETESTTREGFATIPVFLFRQPNYQPNRSIPAAIDAAPISEKIFKIQQQCHSFLTPLFPRQ